jgi:hypothetical protein
MWFVVLLLLGVVVGCFAMAVQTSKAKKRGKAETLRELEARGAVDSVKLPHTAGLSVPEGTPCTLFVYPYALVINCGGVDFRLEAHRIKSMVVKTDIDIQKQLVSSAGGAVGGALLFGPIGALIGGRAKTKRTTEVHSYLILTYMKDGDLSYIAFDANDFSARTRVNRICEMFKLPKEETTITL